MKNNKKSTMLKDAMALFLITLISGLALSFVYEITKAPIKAQEMAKKLEAYQVVYTDAETIEEDTELMELAASTDLASINPDYQGCTVDEINKAYDANGNMIGYIIKVSTTKGYKDVISVAIGYSLDKTVKGLEILSINETAGLGMNADTPDFKNQFINKSVDQFETTKAGASADNQINAISGATITTNAVVNAVNAGLGFVSENSTEFGGGANE